MVCMRVLSPSAAKTDHRLLGWWGGRERGRAKDDCAIRHDYTRIVSRWRYFVSNEATPGVEAEQHFITFVGMASRVSQQRTTGLRLAVHNGCVLRKLV